MDFHDHRADSTPESVTGQASQVYFQAVTGYLDDLFGGNVQAQSLYQVNVWVERYAHKIEDLNKQNVDQDVLSYAGNVVMLLNEIGSNVQAVRCVPTCAKRHSTAPGATADVRDWERISYYEKPYVARDRALVQADEASQGLGATAQQIITELHQLSNQTRQEMTEVRRLAILSAVSLKQELEARHPATSDPSGAL